MAALGEPGDQVESAVQLRRERDDADVGRGAHDFVEDVVGVEDGALVGAARRPGEGAAGDPFRFAVAGPAAQTLRSNNRMKASVNSNRIIMASTWPVFMRPHSTSTGQLTHGT